MNLLPVLGPVVKEIWKIFPGGSRLQVDSYIVTSLQDDRWNWEIIIGGKQFKCKMRMRPEPDSNRVLDNVAFPILDALHESVGPR